MLCIKIKNKQIDKGNSYIKINMQYPNIKYIFGVFFYRLEAQGLKVIGHDAGKAIVKSLHLFGLIDVGNNFFFASLKFQNHY